MLEPVTVYRAADGTYALSVQLTDAAGGEGGVNYSNNLGVATIDVGPGVKTPEGIGIGSSVADVESAYPGRTWAFDRTHVVVPGNDQADYRIAVQDDKVVELTLQFGNQDCYE